MEPESFCKIMLQSWIFSSGDQAKGWTMAKLLDHQFLDNQIDPLFQATDAVSKHILCFSFASFRVWVTFWWPGRLHHWHLISLPPVTFLGLLMDQVLRAVLLWVTPDIAGQSHVAVRLSAGRLGRFGRDEDHASAGRRLRLAAGAVSYGGEHRTVSVAAAWGRPFPVDREIPPTPHLLHLRLNLNHKNHMVHQKPSETLTLCETDVCPDFNDSNNH